MERGGIYVHVPFCVRKCPYCDFYSITNLELKDNYLKAVMGEMEMVSSNPLHFDTIYFGGGTPSLLTPSEVGSVIETAHRYFHIQSEAEVTLEVNPGTVNPEKLRGFRSAGVNRINVGVQSFFRDHLKFLGRIHSSKQAGAAVEHARTVGFDNLGIDLIYGLPGQEESAWRKDLGHAVSYEPEHLSCYMLTCEPGTPLHKRYQEGECVVLSDGRVRSLFEVALDFLGDNHYFHYEISNFARRSPSDPAQQDTGKYQSRHNRKYWSGEPFLGFGPAAHSFVSPVRQWNVNSVVDYIKTVMKGNRPVDASETLTRQQQMMETIYLGLRTAVGIDIEKFDQKFEVSFRDMLREVLGDLQEQRFIILSHQRCRLTKNGMFFLDTIAGRLIERIEQ